MILKNQKHEHFAQLIAKGNITKREAANTAGYSEKGAHVEATRLLKNPKIQARIAELTERKAEKVITTAAITKAWVLEELRENAERCLQRKPILDRNGQEVWAFDAPGANRALELIGKELGMFVERKVIGFRDLRTATAEELMQLLAEIDSMLPTAEEKTQGDAAPSLETGKPGTETLQ